MAEVQSMHRNVESESKILGDNNVLRAYEDKGNEAKIKFLSRKFK